MPPSPISTAAAAAAPNTPSAFPSPLLAPPVDNNSIVSTPRASVSQTDLHNFSDLRELRAKARRWARWSRGHPQGQPQGEGGGEGPTGSANETAVEVDPQDVVEKALRNFKLAFETISSEWAGPSRKEQQSVQPLEELRPRIESNLDRIGSFPRGQDGVAGKASPATPGTTSHWEFTKKNILTLQKIDAWLHKSEHPLRSDVLNGLWRGVGCIVELLTSADNNVVGGLGTLEQFCAALQELSVVLPSSIYHVQSREILHERQVQAVTGLIYTDILELVGSVVQDVVLPGQPEQSVFGGGGGIRQALLGKAREHHHHFTRRNPGPGISVNTNVPIATGSAPTSPTGSIAAMKQPSLPRWKNNLRTILERAGYHSRLLQRELSHLQEREQSGRFRQITQLFDEIEDVEEVEKDCRRDLREIEALMGNSAMNHKPHDRRGSDCSESSEELPLGGISIGSGSRDEHLAGMEEKRAELVRRYRSARQVKDAAYSKLLEQAGHIKCDVCTYTAFEDSGIPEQKDYDVKFSANLREFSDSIGGPRGAKSGSDSSEGSAGTAQRKPLFKLYVTNDNTVEALGEINPQFVLNSRGRNFLEGGPNLWSFARSLGPWKSNWKFIKTTLPNVDKGFGSEARRYAIEVRDETAYFYDTTWKIYWCQPRANETGACPVAILVLAGDDLPLSRPVDPSPIAQRNFQRARQELVLYYRHHFHVPLIDRGSVVSADKLAVQILGETKRRWREVLDKMRHFVDDLTDLLYAQASNSSLSSTISVVEQRKAAEALSAYNRAAGQVFKILIKVNSYESMFIETMSYFSQLDDEDMFLGASKSDLLQLHDEEELAEDGSANRHPPTRSNTRSLSRSGFLRAAHVPKVSWRDIARGHQDLLESLKSTKRKASSLKALIDHEHSMYESRLSNQHSLIANFHAGEATRQADEAAAQNASMRRLTVVTFIFLPLTFMASLFGTNVEELGQGKVPLWMFFAVGVPFAGAVLAAWGYLEFWKQGTKSEGKGGELSASGRRRVEEFEMEMQRASGLAGGQDEEAMLRMV